MSGVVSPLLRTDAVRQSVHMANAMTTRVRQEDHFRAVQLLPAPATVVALVLAAVIRQQRLVGQDIELAPPRRVDWLGLALAAAALGCLVLVITEPAGVSAAVSRGARFPPVTRRQTLA